MFVCPEGCPRVVGCPLVFEAPRSRSVVPLYGIVKALVESGFDGYVRPDHGRNIWGEDGKPGYGLFDRALGATYLYGLFEAVEKAER